jgi:hypothetical protein
MSKKINLLLTKLEITVHELFSIESIFDLNGTTKFILLKHKKYQQYIFVVFDDKYNLKKNHYRGNITNITLVDEKPIQTSYFDAVYDSLQQGNVNLRTCCFLTSKGLFFSNSYYLLYEENFGTDKLLKEIIPPSESNIEEDIFALDLENDEISELIFVDDDNEDIERKRENRKQEIYVPSSTTIPIETIKNLDNNMGTVIPYLTVNTFFGKLNSKKDEGKESEITTFILTFYKKIEEIDAIIKKNIISNIGEKLDKTKEHVLLALTNLMDEEKKRSTELERLTKLIIDTENDEDKTYTPLRTKISNLQRDLLIHKLKLREEFMEMSDKISLLLDFFNDKNKYKS